MNDPDDDDETDEFAWQEDVNDEIRTIIQEQED